MPLFKGSPSKTCPSADGLSSGSVGVFVFSENGFKMIVRGLIAHDGYNCRRANQLGPCQRIACFSGRLA
jgi:hypothetical protein